MALPPERITIKRRREDEPVEALCKQATSLTLHRILLLIGF